MRWFPLEPGIAGSMWWCLRQGKVQAGDGSDRCPDRKSLRLSCGNTNQAQWTIEFESATVKLCALCAMCGYLSVSWTRFYTEKMEWRPTVKFSSSWWVKPLSSGHAWWRKPHLSADDRSKVALIPGCKVKVVPTSPLVYHSTIYCHHFLPCFGSQFLRFPAWELWNLNMFLDVGSWEIRLNGSFTDSMVMEGKLSGWQSISYHYVENLGDSPYNLTDN